MDFLIGLLIGFGISFFLVSYLANEIDKDIKHKITKSQAIYINDAEYRCEVKGEK